MHLASSALFLVVAALHLAFFALESFLWTRPFGLKLFGQTPEEAAKTAVLAQNQGLYNAFLAAGIVWSFTAPDGGLRERLFFGACVVVAGVVGAITTRRRQILVLQAVPALAAIGLALAAR